ncbi:MAG: acyl-CoA dehydrogenase family protein [Proteobacteria bacterium]|nr:acyl-CoA dehydrogenase family protein [Pseudomonadota bacterium]MBU2469280.1 acyl-CoA dehydrogenase family protein [Pseudomonadota bacterium]MBU2517990.1 acyl-CoA dehydrogenase family protein [Pseudomonadota bacterium]
MNFALSQEQKEITELARKFAQAEFPKIAIECDKQERYPKEMWQQAAELGFMGIFIPEQYGGLGLGISEHAMVTEEFWRADPGVGCILLAVFGAEIIMASGTEEQKQRWLPKVAAGEIILATAITEPNAGSDIFAQSTTAKKRGDKYILNGSKQFITNGTVADHVLVMCRTNPEEENRLKRYSFLVVDRGAPGFNAEKLHGKLGIRASDTATLSFDDVEVPAENLIGGVEGQGFKQVMHLFNINRVVAASQGVGVAQGSFDHALAYTKEREQFGSRLASFQGVQFILAEMAAKVEAARQLCRMAAWQIDNNQASPHIISIAKLVAGQNAVWVSQEAVQLLGGYGYMDEYHVERFYRDAKIVEIYEGAREIEKLTIAREILGRS